METTRATVYLDAQLHRALRLKSATTHRSMSQLINQAVRDALSEDEEDLAGSLHPPGGSAERNHDKVNSSGSRS